MPLGYYKNEMLTKTCCTLFPIFRELGQCPIKVRYDLKMQAEVSTISDIKHF